MTRADHLRHIPVVLALAATASAGFSQTSAPASSFQQPAADPRRELPNFVGASYNLDSTGLNIVRRRFEPGARTSWHAHGADFFLMVEDGRARVQTQGQPMRELKKGDTDFTPAGVMHWHGAAPDSPFTQFGVAYGTGIKYGERVTDEEYAGGSEARNRE
jgi:quercetin dioxygenase-like cupin family protein